MTIKQRKILQLFFFFKPSLNSSAFLRFSGAFFSIMLFFEILIDLMLDFQFSMIHISQKIAVYFCILIPNAVLLCFFKIDPLKNLIYLTSFLIASFLLRISLCHVEKSLSFDLEVILYCLFSFQLYSIFILLIPNHKFRVLLIFLQQMAIASFLNLKWQLTLNLNMKLAMSLVINLTVFWKTSEFSFQNTQKVAKTPIKKNSTAESKPSLRSDWKGLLEDIPEGLLIISHDKNIIYSNQNSLELLDMESNSCTRKPSLKFYQSVVSKLGKMGEIQSFLGNTEEKKSAEHGFTIMESSAGWAKNNGRKISFLGVNPVNIFSSNAAIQIKLNTLAPPSHIFGRNWTVDDNIKHPGSPSISLGEKGTVNEKSENNLEGFLDTLNKFKKGTGDTGHSGGFNDEGKKMQNQNSMSEHTNYDRNLDEIIDMLISNPSKTIKIYHSEAFEANRKKIELKIKKISFENSPAFLITIQDVSYLKFVQQVCENNEYKNKVLTTLSHELRTPLNGALIPLEKLLNENIKEMQDSDEVYEGVDIAYKSIVLLQNVLNDVVDFALINSNQLYLNYEELDIYEFFDNIIGLFRRQAQEKQLFLDLIFDSPSKISRVLKTDFQRLGQILVSLLNNSMKNTFEGGIVIHVNAVEKSEANAVKHCLKIIIEDTGVGIQEPKLSNIQRCLKTKDLMKVCENLNKNQGCGLGLVISHCLALLLGPPESKGLQIKCNSQKGAEFFFYLEVLHETEDENLEVIEEKSKEFTKTSPTNKTSSPNIDNFLNSMSETSKKKKGKSPKRESNDELIESERSIEKKLCESERSSKRVVNFLHSHNIHMKTMMQISINFSEILIVDDDSFNLLALEAILSKFNLKSVRAFNGQQALDIISERFHNFPKSQVFSILFLDYHMPIKNGVETTIEIMKMFEEDGLVKFPIVACTAFGAKELFEQWSHIGVSDFLIKPVNFQKIERLLRNFNILT